MHSSLRSVIERTFGVWKKKWHILKDMEGFSFEKQVKTHEMEATRKEITQSLMNARGNREF